ncbi:MAG: glycosyltransferase family 2 protein [Halobacteriales archaeon]|nr:glycosyltransferase family 2 protein [Halobacteriales archaeon]
MLPSALFPLLGLAALGAVALPVLGTLRTARWARAPVEPASAWRPPATVILPCRGEHPGLAANLDALGAQDYPRYEVLLVVDAKDDPCAAELAAFAARFPAARIVLSAPERLAEGWASGKIVAQLTGLAHADPESEVVVFADADIRPPPRWLASLVAPLADPRVGAVTGYRWYMADGRATAWTALRDAWNAVGVDALTMARFRFLWGGSMAARRRDLARCDLARHWKRHVSEDVGLTRAIEGLGLGIAFAPGAMVASRETWDAREVRGWMARQTALTRDSMPHLYRFAWAVYGLSAALALLAVPLLLDADGVSRGIGLAFLLPLLSAVPRAWLRERLVRRALPAARMQPWRERLLQLGMSVAVTPAMLAALARAQRMRDIAWRGRTYRLGSPDAGGPRG